MVRNWPVDFPQIVLSFDQHMIMVFIPRYLRLTPCFIGRHTAFPPFLAFKNYEVADFQPLLVVLTKRLTCKILLKVFHCKNLFNSSG